jgi:uncharacterized repeat protein (TIGR01451 family)
VVADLVITKEIANAPIVAGQPVIYEITVTNNGPSDAPDVLFSDVVPEGTTLIPQPPPAPLTCGAAPEDDLVIVSCTAPLLRVGERISGPLTIAVPPDRIEDVANTAVIGSAALDRELFGVEHQNEATAVGPVTAAPVPAPAPAPSPAPAPAPSPRPDTGGGVAATGLAIGGLVLAGLALGTAGLLARRIERRTTRG